MLHRSHKVLQIELKKGQTGKENTKREEKNIKYLGEKMVEIKGENGLYERVGEKDKGV